MSYPIPYLFLTSLTSLPPTILYKGDYRMIEDTNSAIGAVSTPSMSVLLVLIVLTLLSALLVLLVLPVLSALLVLIVHPVGVALFIFILGFSVRILSARKCGQKQARLN